MRSVLLIAIGMMIYSSAFAGEEKRSFSTVLKEKRSVRQADLMIKRANPNYYKALELYQFAYKSNSSDPKLNYKIGLCYSNTWERTKAIPYLEKALERPENIGVDARVRLASSYAQNYEMDKAIEQYKKTEEDLVEFTFNELNMVYFALTDNGRIWKAGLEPEAKHVKKLLEKKISECENAKAMMASPKDVKVSNLGEKINSRYPEYAPIIKADESELYFTSRRGSSNDKIDKVDGLYYEDIYKAEKEDNQWSSVKKMSEPLNTASHNAALAISADGLTMFLYDLNNQGDILVSELTSKGWSEPKGLDEINSDGTERSICISADKRKMFFERDNKDKTRDIYMTELSKDNKWTKPVKLPEQINSEYDEDGMFFHPDGKTLYFSSNGHNTMGGYDIFKTVLEDGKWSTPENLGYPINTPGDDVFFILSADGKRGYYSSARNDGLGFTDLYMVEMETGSATPATANVTLLTGVVKEDASGAPVNAKIQIIDNESHDIVAELKSNPATGNYLIALPSGRNYGIAIESDEHLFHSENFDIPDGANFKKVEKNITMKKAEVGSNIVLRNIFFDFNQSNIKGESYPELDRMVNQLKKFNSLVIEISGHTDNIGEEEYNQKLSNERAKAVKDYLVSKGIPADRLKTEGYGSKKPIAENVLQDGTDNPDGRQLNRRTEFIIISK